MQKQGNQQNGQQQGQGGKSEKVRKTYEENVNKLKAILGGNYKLDGKKPKVELKGEGFNIINDLFAEEKEKSRQEVREGIKALIKNKTEFNKMYAEKERELKNLEVQKQKEFNEKANALFNKIEGIDELYSQYTETLGEAINNTDSE